MILNYNNGIKLNISLENKYGYDSNLYFLAESAKGEFAVYLSDDDSFKK